MKKQAVDFTSGSGIVGEFLYFEAKATIARLTKSKESLE